MNHLLPEEYISTLSYLNDRALTRPDRFVRGNDGGGDNGSDGAGGGWDGVEGRTEDVLSFSSLLLMNIRCVLCRLRVLDMSMLICIC